MKQVIQNSCILGEKSGDFAAIKQKKQANKLINNVPISLVTFNKIFGSLNYYSVSESGCNPSVPISDDAKSAGSPNGLS